AGYDLVIVETPGIGQGDSGIADLADVSLYVMTPEFGAASQLEKIDMLDFADVVAINKFERRGADDARRDVSRQLVRNRAAFGVRAGRDRRARRGAARPDREGRPGARSRRPGRSRRLAADARAVPGRGVRRGAAAADHPVRVDLLPGGAAADHRRGRAGPLPA